MKKALKLSTAALLAFGMAACSNSSAAPAKTAEATAEPTAEATAEATASEIKFAVVYGAAHGEKCFTSAAVAVNAADGTIVGAFLDEYQFFAADTDGIVAVPNSDGGFGEGAAEGKVLGSKKVNNEYYSKNMAEKGNATVALKDNYAAIEDFAKGKKADELTGVDTVTGATLVDTAGYVALIEEGAKAAMASEKAYAVTDLSAVEIKEAEAAAHGDKCFALVADVVEGEEIVCTSIDEFQYFAADTDGIVGVPNSDKGFGENYAEGKVLGSKKVNAEYYSKNMADKAGSTVTLDKNYEAIEDFCAGKTAADLEGVDSVTGATLVDTAGYIAAVINAADNSK